jgi:calcineurin-like phosphoesterase family protein
MKSALGFTHYTSDPHYGHANILTFCNRPFASVHEQVLELVARHNAVVGPDDHTLFLGDLFLSSALGDVIGRLNGSKTLVAGNHDDRMSDSKLLRLGFERVERGMLDDEIAGQRVRYCHFPPVGVSTDTRYPERRPKHEPGVVLIHGHTHQRERLTPYGTIHVGVNA